MPSSFGEPEPDGHAEMKRRFLVQPDLPCEVVDQLFDELVVMFVDDFFQPLDDFFLALNIGRGEQLVLVQGLDQLVVFGRALLLDIGEAGVPYTVVRHVDALGSRASDIHQIVRSGAHHCLRQAIYYNYSSMRLPVSLVVFAIFASCAQIASTFAQAPRGASADRPDTPGFDFARTMRVDYFHRGGPGGEALRLDGIRAEGAWPGSRTQLVDATDLGKYFFEVIDRASNRVLYSRGFATIYGEWETTPEFRTRDRSFHESVRFPWPSAPVRVAIKKRDPQNVFEPLWEVEVDPASVAAGPRDPSGGISTIFERGSPSRKVDLLLIGDKYSTRQAAKFQADAARLVNALFALEPFKSRRGDFNVRTLHLPGSPMSVEFNIFGLDRYALTYDNRALRTIAAAAPYDVVEILVNETKYGGGGIFNQQSTVAAGNESAEYVFIHELAHNLAGLGDEYVGSVTYETGAPVKVEPWEPNVTALHDPSALKWRDLVEPNTPVPTPMSHAGKVGAFEGAGYEARGLYRPEASCIMGSRKVTDFCRVCVRAIHRIIDLHTK